MKCDETCDTCNLYRWCKGENAEASLLKPALAGIARLLISARSDIVIHGNPVAATSTINLALDEIAKLEGDE